MNDTDVAARLAEALAAASGRGEIGHDGLYRHECDAPRLAALLPVVREIADQRAAEEAAEAARLREVVEALAEAWAHHHRADDVRWAGQQLRCALDGTDA